MKLVKQYINEKFVEDSDPIHDMGIGLLSNIPLLFKEAFEKDTENPYINRDTGTKVKNIIFCFGISKKGKLKIATYTGHFCDYEGKPIKTKDYLNNLLKKTLVSNFIEIPCMYNNKEWWDASFNIKPEYFKYFEKIAGIRFFKNEEKVDYTTLNEKFVENSDSISDMGIGIMQQLNKFLELHISYMNKERDYPCPKDDIILLLCVDNNKYEFVEYLLNKGANVHTGGGYHRSDRDLPMRYAIWNNNLTMVKLLLKYGASVKNCLSEDEFKYIIIGKYISVFDRASNSIRKIAKDEVDKELKWR